MTDESEKYQDAQGTMPSVVTRRTALVSTTVEHPKLLRFDPESIRVFLRLYNQYKNELMSRNSQMSSENSTDRPKPIELKFCVDAGYLESLIDLELIKNCSSYEDLTDAVLKTYLESEAEVESKTSGIEKLDELVEKNLRMDMRNPSCMSRMKDLFVCYNLLLKNNGLSWVKEKTPKLAINHIVSAIRPKNLQIRIERDLKYTKSELKKDYKGFMTHAFALTDSFEMIDIGPKPTLKGTQKAEKNNSPT